MKKSPLKNNPLRNPGETLDQEINDLILDKVMQYLIVIAMMGLLTFVEVWLWWFEIPRSPYIYPIMFVMTLAYCVPKLVQLRNKLKRLRQGRDGEKAVGQYLEVLREVGAKVFHDIPAEGFNLDHVVIASTGIYVVETKTYSKPESGRATIIFDGNSINFNENSKTDKPIIQVSAATKWLQSLLEESTGKKFETKGVVVFPGWFITPTTEAKSSKVWVLNPKALPTFITKSKVIMTNDEVKMASFHLSRYIRNYDSNPR